MLMTKERFELWRQLAAELEATANNILSIYARIRLEILKDTDPKHLDYLGTGSTINFGGDEYWSYGGHKYHHLELPVELLLYSDSELEAKFRAEAENEKKELEDIRASAQTQAEAAERRKLAELKKKYGE